MASIIGLWKAWLVWSFGMHRYTDAAAPWADGAIAMASTSCQSSGSVQGPTTGMRVTTVPDAASTCLAPGGAGARNDIPCGAAPALIGTALQRAPFVGDGQQQQHRFGYGFAIGASQQDADIVGKKFAGMNEGGRDNCPAERDRIRERPRGNLIQVGIGREIDIAKFDLVEQLLDIQKAIVPGNIIGHAEALGQLFQSLPIGLAFGRDECGMCRADDAIQDVGILRGNGR